MDTSSPRFCLPMSFPERLAALRKESGFTQQQMADKIGMHVSQLKRYESGASQPTIEVSGASSWRSTSAPICFFSRRASAAQMSG